MRDNQPTPDRSKENPPTRATQGVWQRFALMRRPPDSSTALTRIELLALLTAITLVALVVAPALASNKSDSERLICFNNLRLIGRGVQIWAGDHNQQFSWRTLSSDGGTMPNSGTKPGNAWFEYSYLSNELVTPKILSCPSDSGALRARNWAEFITPPFRANATSYALSMDGSMDVPRTWLSADHNFRAVSQGGCSALVNNTVSITFGAPVPWTNAVHGEFGHVLTTDGTAEFTSSARLTELLARPEVDDNGSTHFLRGRQ